MKKGIIRLLPLQADLCLNKQKVDIEDFKGWNKCNAPVYGNCLSPLYKKEDTHHDFFIGEDKYDWTEGVLYKNETAVLSGAGSKKIKKTKIAADYSALAISEDDSLTWIKETSGTTIQYSLHGGAAQDATLSNCNRIVRTKSFANDDNSIYGIAVLFLRTDGAYGYFLAWSDNGNPYTSYGEDAINPTRYVGFNVVSPLIQVAVLGANKFMVSFFGSSGANLSGTEVKNVYVQSGQCYDNPTFHDDTNYPTRYETVEDHIGVYVSVNSKVVWSHPYDNPITTNKINFGMRQRVSIVVNPHAMPVEVSLVSEDPDNPRTLETFRFEANENTITYVREITYWDYVNQAGQYSDAPKNRYTLSITSSGTPSTIVNYDQYGTGILAKYEGDYTKADTIKILPAYLINQTSFRCRLDWWTLTTASANDTSLPASTVKKSAMFGGYDKNGLRVINTCQFVYADSCANNALWDNSYASSILRLGGSYGNNVTAGGYCMNYYGNCLYGGGVYMSESRITTQPTWYDANANPSISGSPSYFNFMWNDSQYVYEAYKYKRQYTEQSLKEVDCCMDDGKFYTTGGLGAEGIQLPTKLFSIAGEFDSWDLASRVINYNSISHFNIGYDVDGENVFPKYYYGQNLSIGNGYIRLTYLFKAKKTDKEYINFLVDNLSDSKPTYLYAGVQNTTNGNMQGGIKNYGTEEGFRLLFNNNLVSNISCFEKANYIGTILADWFTVDDTFCPAVNSDTLYYKDNSGHIWKVELVTTGQEWDYRLIENRYVVLNTTNYFNCYDTKTGLKRHWASDYNNRVIFGYNFIEYKNNDTFRTLLTETLFSGLVISAQNANYEMTKDTITGIELGAIPYSNVLKDYVNFKSCDTPYGAVEGIDIYRGDDNSTGALYICSYQISVKYIDNDLVNPYAVYPVPQNGDVRYNPNLFTRFISSYNNKDMVISDGIAYKLLYFNNVIPIMAYNLLDGVEELLDAFVLQSSYYGVSETRLYQMNYSDGVGVEVVCDITNLEYLGALPTQALFWSAQNRAIYTFRGNCIMALSQYANDLTQINNKWYNPATQELFLDTNIGLLVFSDLGTYCLPKFTVEIPSLVEDEDPLIVEKDVKDIFFYPDKFIINLVDDTSHSYYWSYNPLEGYESNKIHFVTKYYGNGKTPVTVNNIYIRLYNQGVTGASGQITFRGHTVTDIGVKTDEKTITIGGENGEEWDAETDTMLVKYTPQYNRGLGFALEVQTTFPIIDIKYDYVEDGTVEGQIAHINI